LTVFVSGLNYQTKEEDVSLFFSMCGNIERINMTKQPNSEFNLGFCHIVYEGQSGYNKALSLNGTKLNGRYLDVIAAKGPTKIEKIKEKLKSSNNITLFIRNIPYDTSEDEIKDLFGKYGLIKAIRLPICRDDPSKLKGICFIDFSDPKCLIEALELDGYNLRGRFLKLDADISYDDATNTKIKSRQNIATSTSLKPGLNVNAGDFYETPQQEVMMPNNHCMQKHVCGVSEQGFSPYGNFNNIYCQDQVQQQYIQQQQQLQYENQMQLYYMEKQQNSYENIGQFYNAKGFENQSNKNYRNCKVEFNYEKELVEDNSQYFMQETKKEKKEDVNMINYQSFRELIDDDMTKELEEFRKNAGKTNSIVTKGQSPK